MTKQKEIRHVIDNYTDDVCLYPNTDCAFRSHVPSQGEYCLDGESAYKCLMKRLGELGVVIKVACKMCAGTKCAYCNGTGYMAVEPLIEDHK